MADTLSIVLNTAQQRLDKERVTITVAGEDFISTNRSNVWTDPITQTTMMLPVCLDPTWQTSSSGDNARLGLSDFGLSAPDWVVYGATAAGQVRMLASAGMGASAALSTSSFGVNRGMYVSFWSYNTGNANDQYGFECGWDDGGGGPSSTAGVALRFFAAHGYCEVWKDGVWLANHEFGGTIVNSFAEFIVLPMRRRELMVYCPQTQQGFVHVFDDIDETETSPIITSDEKFWFYVRNSKPVNVEIAPLKFKESGYVRSKTYSFGRTPQTGQTLGTYTNGDPSAAVTDARVFADPGSWTATDEEITAVNILETDNTAYTPDGTIDQVFVEVVMNSDSGKGYTPFLRGVSTSYQATYVNTDDSEEYDITEYVLAASLSVPDDPGGVELAFTIKDPEGLETDHVAGLLEQENIPCQVKIGTLVIIEGVCNPIKFEDAFNEETRIGGGVIRDRMASMQSYGIRDRIPFDGLELSHPTDPDCAGGLYATVGITETDLDNVGYVIPMMAGKSSSDFTHLTESGTTPFDEMRALVTEIVFGFFWGMKPSSTGPKAIFKDPDTWSGTSFKVYRTPEDAISDGVDAADAPYRCYENYHEEPLPLAGNELRVMGMDPRKQVPIIRWKEDSASKDATLAPSARSSNWCGEPRVVGFQSHRLQTSNACEKLIDTAFPKISARHYTNSADCMMLLDDDGVPAWRGDTLEFDGQREVRIIAFSAEFVSEQTDLVFRSANYVGSAVAFGLGGLSASQIRDNFARFWTNATIRRAFDDALGSKLPNLVAEVP